MLDRDGDVMTYVVPNVKRKTLHPIICENVMLGSTIHSDELVSYKGIDAKGYEHKTCNHGSKQWSSNGSHVNTLEGFWARLKLSIKGTHVHVSKKHLAKYAAEFEYRFNSRNHPERMLSELLSTYSPLPK